MSRNDFLSTFKRISLNFGTKIAIYHVSEPSSPPLGITYSELNRVTDDLSQFFRDFFNSRQNIGVQLDDRFWSFIIILGIWKSGNAYSPLARHEDENLLQKLKIKYVITDSEIGNDDLILEFFINEKKFYIWERQTESRDLIWDMCYGIMTTGSTGVRKVVQVPWSCILPNAAELQEIFNVDENDNIYQSSPCTFDPFFIDLFLAFMTGASLTVTDFVTDVYGLFFDREVNFTRENKPTQVEENQFVCDINLVSCKKPTFIQITPSLFLKWGMENIKNILLNSSLRILVLGGEKFPNQIFNPKSSVKLFNIYGITEISCWAFLKEIKNSDVSIGKPLNGIIYKIENNELIIGSKHRKCLVDNDDVFNDEEIVYRATGDLVEIINGEIYYKCRTKQMIKRLGIKVDLTKIEKKFLTSKNVTECCCVFDEVKKNLNVFLVCNDKDSAQILTNQKIIDLELQSSITELTDIEKPDYLIKLPSLLINANGKCDKRKLLEISAKLLEEKEELTLEEKFFNIWKSVLNLDKLKNFKESGGNSVMALLMTNKLDDANVKVPNNFLTVLFEDGDFENCLEILKEQFEMPSKKLRVDSDVSLDFLWKFDCKKCVDASPVVAEINGKMSAIVGSHSSLLSSIDLETGTENWTVKLGDRIESACCVSKNCTNGFIGCYDHFVYSISLSDGKIIWKYETGDMIKSTPCLSTDEKIVFVASYDTFLYGLNFSDGICLRKIKLSEKGIYCSGIVSQDSFYIGTLDGTCVSINQNANEILWKNKLTSPIFASPCLYDENSKSHVIFIEVIGRIHFYCADTGNKIWCYEANGNIYSSPTISQNFLLFGCHDRFLYCLQIGDAPSLKYKTQYDSAIFSGPLLINPRNAKPVIAVASTKGFLYLSNFDSGTVLTNFKLPGEIFSSPHHHQNRIIVGCRDNNLYCLKIFEK